MAYFWSPLSGSATPVYSLANPVASNTVAGDFQVLTNTSGQIYVANDTATGNSVYISTYGWIDNRGKL